MAVNKKLIVGGGAGAIASAMFILIPMLKEKEGLSLKSYKDTAGIYTICYGHAYVKANLTYTKKQCEDLLKADAGERLKYVYNAIKVDVRPEVLAAHTHFAFNIGLGAYQRSNTLKLTNQGKIREGCNAMANWFKSNGEDCRAKLSKCPGVWSRRKDEIALCLVGSE